jgi:hypothetical protein
VPNQVYVKGHPLSLKPAMVVGQGGEAVIYKLKGGEALKAYMEPNDPIYSGNQEAIAGARLRLDEYQTKLPVFPKNLPERVVKPVDLAYDNRSNGRIVGYTMPFLDGMETLLSYSDRKFRELANIDPNQVVEIFRDLHGLVGQVHTAGVVIGDFNDLNVLVDRSNETHLVDADSMQFGQFPSRTFTARFVDPLLSETDRLVLKLPHREDSDWYAFTTMLFQSLLFINPYFGGVHKPRSGKSYRNDARVLQRISVFSPEVIYPKVAYPLTVLPDELLEHFQQVFEKDLRGDFPDKLLEDLRWTRCSNCHLWHTRPVCPVCAAPGVVKQTISVRGKVVATRFFQTQGRIIFATYQNSAVRYVYHEDGAYKREGDNLVLNGDLDGELRVRIWSDKTVFAKGNQLIVTSPSGAREHQQTELVGRLPIFDANSQHLYWIDQGRLVRDGSLAPVAIGETLPNQTLVWVGQRFGFGFYRAGALTRGLIFNAERGGINDTVPVPSIRGNLIDATCTFSDHLVWVIFAVSEQGVINHYCYVLSEKGELIAQVATTKGDGTWLGESIRGHLALGNYLYAATDSGIIRVGVSGKSIRVDREFPDTQDFVSTETQLLPGKGGITAVSSREIVLLQLN